MFEVSLAGAFLGGVLALLSPCSALLLPSFFAYAFKSKRRLLARTLVYYAGLCTLFIPLGIGASFAGALVLDYRSTAILVAGAVLIVFGVLELLGMGFSWIPQRWGNRPIQDTNVSVYATGVVYGFAGFCSGPLLGAVLTMAAGAATPFSGGALLAVYALGMAAPLFLLASLWDRFDLGQKQWLRGKVVQVGNRTIHTSNLIAGLLFIGIGLMFVLTQGTFALERLYESLGLITFSFRAQTTIDTITRKIPDWAWLSGLLLLGITAFLWRRRRRVDHAASPFPKTSGRS